MVGKISASRVGGLKPRTVRGGLKARTARSFGQA